MSEFALAWLVALAVPATAAALGIIPAIAANAIRWLFNEPPYPH